MGKSNRIRVNRANEAVRTINVKKKKEMPGWLMSLIAIVLTVAIVGGVALTLLSANGVFNRITTTVSSENYKVNANMMSYYFRIQYDNFYSTYSSYISSILDTSKSLKEQNYSEATETTEAVTWFDYFMDQTVESVKSMLIYCEEAKVRGIDTLDEEEKAQIEESIQSLETTATAYGYTLNSYISAVYGSGVKATDLRKAMTYSAIASKCMNVISEELNNAITDEQINAEYTGDLKEYNVIDYTYYTFQVTYDEAIEAVLGKSDYTDDEANAQKEAILAKYSELIAEAKETANRLKAITDADEFKREILTLVAEDAWDSVYGEKTIEDADKPSEENVTKIREKLLAAVVNEVMDGKEEATADAQKGEGENTNGSVYEIEITNTYADTLNSVKEDIFAKVLKAVDTYVTDKGTYTENNDFSTWAFGDGRAAGDTTVIVTGDGKEDGEISADTKTSSVSVYLIRKAQYADTEKARNVAYMIFGSESDAKAAIEALLAKENMSLEIFEAYADENESATSHATLEDYTEGTIGSTVFDEWVYGESTGVGMITATPLTISTGTYAVVYYYAEGNEMWKVEVKSAILSDQYEAEYANMESTYAITLKGKALDKVDA